MESACTWAATLSPLARTRRSAHNIGELVLTMTKSDAGDIADGRRTSLFMAVVDNSGSMAGRPWEQVQLALRHLVGMRQTGPQQTVIVTYNSVAQVLDTTTGTQADVLRRIDDLRAGGGTLFRAAFEQVRVTLETLGAGADASEASATIVFLTDGQANDGDRDVLVPAWHQMLLSQPVPLHAITVHTVGFGGTCDRQLLEGLRQAQTNVGTFRYAAPEDEGDALCHKLTSLFDAVAATRTTRLTVRTASPGISFLEGGDQVNAQFSWRRGGGTLSLWVEVDPLEHAGATHTLSVHMPPGEAVTVTVIVAATATGDARGEDGLRRYIHSRVDQASAELMSLIGKQQPLLQQPLSQQPLSQQPLSQQPLSQQPLSQQPLSHRLHVALLRQRVQAMQASTSDQVLSGRLDFLSDQLDACLGSGQLDLGKLADCRFGSLFAAAPEGKKRVGRTAPAPLAPTAPLALPQYAERTVRYRRGVAADVRLSRSPLMSAVLVARPPHHHLVHEELRACLDAATPEDLACRDANGNTALHLAAYTGAHAALAALLAHMAHMARAAALKSLADTNADGETPATLAIKGRGFHRSLELLLDAGAAVPPGRLRGLEAFAVSRGYVITGGVLGDLCPADGQRQHDEDGWVDIETTCVTAEESMTPAYLRYVYDRAVAADRRLDAQAFLSAALAKGMEELAATLLRPGGGGGAQPTPDLLADHCVPPRADAPDEEAFLRLAILLLDAAGDQGRRDLVCGRLADGSTPLFRAAERGSRGHVLLFLQAGAQVDAANGLGTTPLWVACAKRYPCIVDTLLEAGADPGHANGKGNPPLYPVCQRGPPKLAERLLAAGADPAHINANGDTLVLQACRHGQHEVLHLLLSRVDPTFASRRAAIDGFDAALAATESDRPDALRVLHEFDVDLDRPAEPDNAIVPGGAPLHLAAYYGCAAAARALLECGADPHRRDAAGMTPLHVACLQAHSDVALVLCRAGADPRARDQAGCTPMTYAGDAGPLARKMADPAADELLELATGSGNDEAACLGVLAAHAGDPVCRRARSCEDVTVGSPSHGCEGSPLLQATAHSRHRVVQALLALGADPLLPNECGLTPATLAHFVSAPRVVALFGDRGDPAHLARLRRNARDIFLGPLPKAVYAAKAVEGTPGVGRRMAATFQSLTAGKTVGSDEDSAWEWRARLFALNQVTRPAQRLCPRDIVAIFLFTASLGGRRDARMLDALCRLPPLRDREVFVGVTLPAGSRQALTVGAEVAWPGVVSGSTLWRVAAVACGFPQASTVFVCRSDDARARAIGHLSRAPHDAEAVLLPGTRFRVAGLYHGDVTALAQANIRAHTFGVKQCEADRVLAGDRGVIIELEGWCS